jgi:chemotaxis protein CheC
VEITDQLKEINEQAAEKASESLGKLIVAPVDVKMRTTSVKRIEELQEETGEEKVVVGIYLPLSGDLQGSALLTFPMETALPLSDLLVRRKVSTARELSELDKSALKEVGNILVGSYLTVLANRLQIKVIEGLPYLSIDMLGALMEQAVAETAQHSEKVLVVEVTFRFEAAEIKGQLILALLAEELEALVGSLKSS